MIGLYSDTVPLTCENFLQLCKGYRIHDKVIGFRNTQFHLIRPGACLVGGDVLQGSGKTRGISIYGTSFPDENFDMQFLRDGDLAMINWGKNTNSSHFMITLTLQRGVLEEGGEEPGPPLDFVAPVGPLLTEDEFR